MTATATVLAGAAAAAVAAFFSWIVWTGCFFSCDGGDPLGGAALGALAVGLLVSGPLLARVVWRRATSERAVLLWAALCVGLPVLLLLLR